MKIEKLTELPAGEAINYVWENKMYPIKLYESKNPSSASKKIEFNEFGVIINISPHVAKHHLFLIKESVSINEDTRFKEGFYTMKFNHSTPNSLRLNHFDGHSLNSLKEVLKIHEEIVTGFYLPKGTDIIQIWNDKEGFLTDKRIVLNEIQELLHTD